MQPLRRTTRQAGHRSELAHSVQSAKANRRRYGPAIRRWAPGNSSARPMRGKPVNLLWEASPTRICFWRQGSRNSASETPPTSSARATGIAFASNPPRITGFPNWAESSMITCGGGRMSRWHGSSARPGPWDDRSSSPGRWLGHSWRKPQPRCGGLTLWVSVRLYGRRRHRFLNFSEFPWLVHFAYSAATRSHC